MSRTRFAPWVVLACIGTLAACTSGEDGRSGNTELNIIIPNQGPGASTTGQTQVECNTVEYTIVCDGGEQPAGGFLNPGDGFADAVTLNGNLAVNDNAVPAVAQGYMDIPPGDCLVQLRCRDADDEVICIGDNVMDTASQNVAAGETQVVNIVLDCGNISYQVPVGQLDVRGDFQFSIGNFCPDLFVLNCVDTVLGPDGVDPGPEVEGETTCEVRFRDNDTGLTGCGEGCDPQVCFENADGLLTCSPASPPEDQLGNSMQGVNVRTTVTCDRGTMDCLGAPSPGGNACTYDGDQLGTLAVNTEILPNDPAGPSAFKITCTPGVDAGQTITCEAYTTDGDRDCDKTKIVTVSCAGLTPCGTLGEANGESPDQAGGDAVCDAADGTVCRADICNDATCDGSDTGVCCDQVNAPDTTDCAAENGGLPAECQSGVCVPQDCNTAGCEDQNDCTLPQICNTGNGLCEPDPAAQAADGTTCDVIWGSGTGDGVCEGGSCDTFVCDDIDLTNCTAGTQCQDTSCDTTTQAGVCVYTNDDNNTCDTCADTLGNGCQCNAGACEDVPPAVLTCDPTGQGGVATCQKLEFLAIDCALLGNSAALPLDATATPDSVAYAGKPVNIQTAETIILPAPLVCGFLTAGFVSAEVSNSIINQNNTASGLEVLSSFFPTSPHPDGPVSFATACGCPNPTPGTLIPPCGEGPGIIVPFLQNAPGLGNPPVAPPTPPLSLTAAAPGVIDFTVIEPDIALELRNLEAAFTIPEVCVGGSCPFTGAGGDACGPEDRDGDQAAGSANDSPRIMYDAICNKLEAQAGSCLPFEDFAGVADVCVGRTPTTPVDPAICTDVDTCCAALQVLWPTASNVQQPQLPVNPCFQDSDCTQPGGTCAGAPQGICTQ